MNYHLTYFNRIRSLILILVAVMITGSSLAQQKSFEFVVLPDTQTYVEEYPEIYLHQM